MKIRLLTPQHILAPAGTEIEVDDGKATLLIEIGAAEKAGKPKKTTAKAKDA